MPQAFGYIATTQDDMQKQVILCDQAMSLSDLRNPEPTLATIGHVGMTMGGNHPRIITDIQAIDGVKRVELLCPAEEGDEGDPLDGDFIVWRTAEGNWDAIMPAVRQAVATILDYPVDQVTFEDFTYND